ncbi:MAG: enoyl-CoA hydratase/isomerase family protein [Rhodospirillaceae bacterium]|nr:enoyl-CoA hydratase/isomerase family protein [Rhodospirillaceae bacterium]
MKYRFIDWQEFEAPGATDGEAVGVLTLNRPDRKNALGPRMAMELDTIFGEIRHKQVRVVVITGAGETFCSGGDLKEETLPLERPGDDLGIRGEYGELAQWMINDHFHVIAQRALRKLEELPQPVIAAIDGAAVGAGFEMTLACDLRIMTDRARVSEIAVPAGFVSEWSCPRNLPKLVGLTLANELILTGRFVEAAEARAIGLVNRVVAPENLMDEAMTLASQIARMPYLGVRYAKELIQLYNQDNRTPENYKAELDRVMEIIRTDDSAEGIRALLERRPVRWAE